MYVCGFDFSCWMYLAGLPTFIILPYFDLKRPSAVWSVLAAILVFYAISWSPLC